ncbi:MAG TPA: choice-of-anchor B family protein, partial [Gemmatimonadales bacterium]|nr:choice-of-anchor B family protein [Gemmatimonadales bacterium]
MPQLIQFLGILALVATPAAAQTRYTEALVPPASIGFATAIALQGQELFVGRTGGVQGFPLNPSHPGAVHVFRRGGDGGWSEAAALSLDELTLGDQFASAIAVDGDLLAVGAPAHGEAGAVYLFERRGGGWRPAGKLEPPAGARGKGDEFGRSLALQGTLLVVGAPSHEDSRGAVYAYRRDGKGNWSAPVTVGAGAAANDRYGRSLALAGDRLLVGAPGPHASQVGPQDSLQPKPGAAIVYRAGRDGRWTEETRLGFGADSAIGFGFGVHLSATEALVGAPGGAGAVYAFTRKGDEWTPAGRLVAAAPEPGSYFGFTLARTGSTVFVGAELANQNTGRVHVFERSGDGWRETQQLETKKSGFAAQFGASMAAAGDIAVIGSPLNDFFEGTAVAYARDRARGRWQELGTITDKPASLPAITGRERKCEAGKIEMFSCEQVDLLGFLPNAAIGGKRGIMLNDIWGWTDPQTGREYALVGRMDGTAFVDVTDPSHPLYLGDLPLHPGANPNLWRDIKVYKDHAFIVADGAGPHGMQVFDLTQLRDVKGPPVTFGETAHYDRIWSAHNIAINEETGFAYPVGNSAGGETCGGALHMIDIRDPKHPTFAGCYADPSTGRQRTGYTHDAECVVYRGPDARYAGRE